MEAADVRCLALIPSEGATEACASCQQSVLVTAMGENRAYPGSRLLALRPGAAEVLLSHALKPAALIEIECSEMLILGEVAAAEEQAPFWKMTISTSHVIRRRSLSPFFADRSAAKAAGAES